MITIVSIFCVIIIYSSISSLLYYRYIIKINDVVATTIKNTAKIVRGCPKIDEIKEVKR